MRARPLAMAAVGTFLSAALARSGGPAALFQSTFAKLGPQQWAATGGRWLAKDGVLVADGDGEGGHETGTEEAFRVLDRWLGFKPARAPTGVVPKE